MNNSNRIWQCLVFASALFLSACGSPEERAQGYYERGIALIEKKDDLAARLELLNAVKFKGDKIEAWRALEGIDERTKAYQALFRDLQRIVELDPSDVEARVRLGRMLLGGGAPEAALKIIEAAGDAANRNAAVHALKASVLVRLRDTSGALVRLSRQLNLIQATLKPQSATCVRQSCPEAMLTVQCNYCPRQHWQRKATLESNNSAHRFSFRKEISLKPKPFCVS